MLIVGAIELGDGNIPGRLRLAEISHRDGWSGYAAVPDRHNVHVVGKTAAHLVLPWIHQVFSNLKGSRGVYHGLRRKHPQAYHDKPRRNGDTALEGLWLDARDLARNANRL